MNAHFEARNIHNDFKYKTDTVVDADAPRSTLAGMLKNSSSALVMQLYKHGF